MIAAMSPEDSWVAKWQRISEYFIITLKLAVTKPIVNFFQKFI